MLKLEVAYFEKPKKENQGWRNVSKFVNYLDKLYVKIPLIVVQFFVLKEIIEKHMSDEVLLFWSSFWLTLIIGIMYYILVKTAKNLLKKSLTAFDVEKRLNGSPVQNKLFKKLVYNFDEGKLNITEIVDAELQVKILKESSDYTDLKEALSEIKFTFIYQYKLEEIFGEETVIYELKECLEKLPLEIETYFSRKHSHSVLELFKLYPLIYSFEKLLKLIDKDKETFLKNNSQLGEVEETAKELYTRIIEIKNESDKLYEIDLETENNVAFKNVVNLMIDSRQYL